MMHDDRSGGLLGIKLERSGQRHTDRLLHGQQLEQQAVLLDVGAGGVPPGVPQTPLIADPQLLLNSTVCR